MNEDDPRGRGRPPPSPHVATKCGDDWCPSRTRCQRFTAPDGPGQSYGEFDRRGAPSCSWFMPRRG